MAREEFYKVTPLGSKRNHKKQLEQRFKVEIDEKEVRRLSIDIAKQKRDILRQAVKMAKHTVRKRQAQKRLLICDFAIGRMVFFNDDMKTALSVAKQFYKTKGDN